MMTNRIRSKLTFIARSLSLAMLMATAAVVAAPAANALSAPTTGQASLACSASYEFDLKNMIDSQNNFNLVYRVRFENKGKTQLSAKVPVRVYTSVRSLKGLETTKPFWSTTQYVGKLPAGSAQNLTFTKAKVGLTVAEQKAYSTDPNAFTHTKRLSFTTQYVVDGKSVNCSQSRVMDILRTKTTGPSPKTVYIDNRNYIDL